MDFFEPYKSGCLVRIKLTPGASFCGFGEPIANAEGVLYLKTYVRSVPEKGRANIELIKLLAKSLKIAKQDIEIISGNTDHYKKIYIEARSSVDDLCNLIKKLAENKT